MGSRDAALVDDMGEIQRALGLLGQDFVDRVTAKLEERNQSSSDSLDIECAICFEPFEHEHDERVTQCLHSFCKACTEELFNSPVRTADLTEAQQADGMRQCPMCRSALGRQCTFRASAFFNPLAGSDNEAKGSPSSTIGKHPVRQWSRSPAIYTAHYCSSAPTRMRTSSRTASDGSRARERQKPSPRLKITRRTETDEMWWIWRDLRSSRRRR